MKDKLVKGIDTALSYAITAVGLIVTWVAMATVFPVSKCWHLGRLSAENAINGSIAQQMAEAVAARRAHDDAKPVSSPYL